MLDAEICARALGARDPRFDGLFFVGITSTGVYCRPVCPARVSYPERRRFFESPAAAECAGFRPCLRCRPELAPGKAIIDAIPRLAHVAAHRIAAGALNDHSVGDLARELGVSERHLRRALEREVGVSPVELAQTHRLLLAKRLLADTSLPVTRVAYASGFQSLRRFNAVFRERYRMSPSTLRRGRSRPGNDRDSAPLRLTLAYRPPLAWNALLDALRRDALPGVEAVGTRDYRRTVRVGTRTGVVSVRDGAPSAAPSRHPHLIVEVSPGLLPVLMPLLARLRHLFDLDAEPSVIDAQLEQGGLGSLVRSLPGIRLPGAFDGFDVAFGILVRGGSSPFDEPTRRVIQTLGDPFDGGDDGLTHFAPTATRVREAGECELAALGVQAARASALVTIADRLVAGKLRLEPGSHAEATHRQLVGIDGVGERLATAIVARALQWPDAFSPHDPALQDATAVSGPAELIAEAERWRPWRAYAALHLGRRAAQGRGIPA
jgi:AraC family transcriptional regulator of adaptative response / DNA-3-methyladenine glycosylase II